MNISKINMKTRWLVLASQSLLAAAVMAQPGVSVGIDGALEKKDVLEVDLDAPRIVSVLPRTGSRIVDNIGVDSIAIQFTELVTVPEDALAVSGLSSGEIGIDGLFFDADTMTLTVELDRVVRSDILTVLVDFSILDNAGNPLDGEVINPSAAIFPTGDGTAGGLAVFRYEILQGDVDRNGIVDSLDGEIIRSILGEEAGSPIFDQQADLNGDGFINVLDIAIWANGVGEALPETDGVAPRLLGLVPDPSLALLEDLSVLELQFSEDVADFSLLDRTVFALDTGGVLHVPSSASVNADGKSVVYVFDPPLLQCDVYEIRISNALSDLSGSLLEAGLWENISGLVQPDMLSVDSVVGVTSNTTIQISGSVQNSQVVEIVAPSGTLLVDVVESLYETTVTLQENQLNTISVTAISPCGARSLPRIVQTVQDLEAPSVFIDFPLAGSEIQADTTDVAGRVSDRLSGALGLEVLVNGLAAAVDVGIGTNGTFFIQGVPLNAQGTTDIVVQASDMFGNLETVQVAVQRVGVPPNAPVVASFSGNAQSGQVDQLLDEPIRVQVVRGDGSPFAGKVVTFRVIRSNGKLAQVPGVDGVQMLQAVTDSQGFAQAYWTLGSDAGSGNNRVNVTSQDIAGTVIFCASGVPAPADRIFISDMNNQRAEAGGPLPLPLRVWVSDLCNGIEGVPVTFTVVHGDGVFENGDSQITAMTGATGHLEVPFVLGQTPGRNVIEATFPTNPGLPVTFVATGIERDLNLPTTFWGTVLDNVNRPLGNARVELSVNNLIVGETFTNIDGEYEFIDVPDGLAHVLADGTTANTLAGEPIPLNTFPYVGYDFTMVPNAENRLPQPAFLPEKNINNRFVYDGTQTVQMRVEGIDGVEFTVQAGTTVTLTDGTVIDGLNGNSVVLSLDQVHFDNIPMPLPDGAAYPFAWTLQPKAATFDPPISVELPNMAGLDPGSIAYILQWDGEVDEFVIAASGRVSGDGLIIQSDPGAGISVAGWGGACPPYPEQGTAEQCDSEPNGCGPGGNSIGNRIKNFLIPDGFTFEDIYVDFNQYGCDDHDRCYGTVGADKAQCDLDFFNGLLSGCDKELDFTVSPSARGRCQIVAFIYYRAMQTQASMDAYNTAQEEARRCEGAGMPDMATYLFENATTDVEPPFDDFDLDGMEDVWELENGLSPLDPTDAFDDNDQDGIQNLFEYAMLLDPNNPDTDGNGIGDGEELRLLNPRPGDVIDPSWEVQIAGRVVAPGPFGRMAINNLIVTGVPIRLDAVRRHEYYETTYAISDFTLVRNGESVRLSNIRFSTTPFPRPVSLAVELSNLVLRVGETVQMEVTADMTDGSVQEVNTFTDGTSYSVSNPDIAQVSTDGLFTALDAGVVFVTANNQGTAAVRRLTIVNTTVETEVRGFVFLPDGSPVEGAIVETNFGGSAMTDSNGSYSVFLNSVPADDSIVSVSASFDSMGQSFAGVSGPTEIVAGGFTDSGIILLNALSTGPLFDGQEFFIGGDSRVATLVDLNGDGNLDMATVTVLFGSGKLGVRINNGEGDLFPVQTHDVGSSPSDFVYGDLDSDGDVDIVVANASSFLGLTILLNDGDGTSFARQDINAIGLGGSVDIGDLDGDGDLDIVATNRAFTRDVRVLFNNGDGTFSGADIYDAGDNPNSLALGDLDGDGDLDMAVTNSDLPQSDIRILFNDGNGIFDSQGRYDTERFPSSVSLGDLDGDGDLDMATLSPAIDEIALFFNMGDGIFTLPQQYRVGDQPGDLMLGDLNGDGSLDIGATSSNDLTLNVLMNNGDGTFAENIPYATGNRPSNIQFADYDNDGDLDAVVTLSSSSVNILRNQADGVFETTTRIKGQNDPQGLVFGDINNDGLQDMIVGGPVISTIINSGGDFDIGQVLSAGGSPWNLALDDLNGDGNLDIVSANFRGNSITVSLNNGDGTFPPLTSYPVGTQPLALIVEDFDGDGDLDLFAANSLSDDVSILLNNGDGSFALQQRYAVGDFPRFSAFGDIDSDGDVDIVVGNSSGSQLSVLFNNGNGTFAPAIQYDTSVMVAFSLWDLDGDGDLDIALGLFLGEVGVFLNNGDGTFAAEQRYTVGDSPQNMLLADFDGDADFDIVTANFSSDDVSVLLNMGDGTFSSQQLYDVGNGPFSMALSDLDGDGILDISIGNFGAGGGNVSVLLGLGDGTFEPQQQFSAGSEPRSLTVGDLDGDGDLDMAVTNQDQDTISVLFNRRVQSESLLAGGRDSWKNGGRPTQIKRRANNSLLIVDQDVSKSATPRMVPDLPTLVNDSPLQSDGVDSSPRHIQVDALDIQILTEDQVKSLFDAGEYAGLEVSLKNKLGQRVEARVDSETGFTSSVLIDFDGTEKTLPKNLPALSTYPVAINERGDVIGVSDTGEGWVWRYTMPDSIESIGLLGGSKSVASFWLGLVAVLGHADLPDGDIRAVLWTPGDELLDLSGLASEQSVTLNFVLGVLPGGVVIAQGSDRHGNNVIVSMTLRLTESTVGDVNGNGIVDEIDVGLILELIESQNLVGDLNFDGLIDTNDLLVVIQNLGKRTNEIHFD